MPVCDSSLASLEEEVKPVGSKRRLHLLVANSSFKKAKVEEVKTEDETVDSCVLCDKIILQPGTSLRFHYTMSTTSPRAPSGPSTPRAPGPVPSSPAPRG